jgi:SAM-dependent methyltransferase
MIDAPPGALFETLAGQYSYMSLPPYGQVFAEVVDDESRRRGGQCRVLDIGCGRGVGRDASHQWKIKEQASDYWGLEPDPDVTPAAGLFDHYQHALMETAELPAGQFDVAYSAMVMEHVADPVAFLSAVRRVLKPGGVYLFVTPNARSFVPWATKTLHALHVDELALRLVRRKAEVDEYHYPVQFKANSPRQLDRLAAETGFDPPQYAYFEGPGIQGYLRGPLLPLRWLITGKRRLIRNPGRLATMLCRMAKPSE